MKQLRLLTLDIIGNVLLELNPNVGGAGVGVFDEGEWWVGKRP